MLSQFKEPPTADGVSSRESTGKGQRRDPLAGGARNGKRESTTASDECGAGRLSGAHSIRGGKALEEVSADEDSSPTPGLTPERLSHLGQT